MLMKNAAFRQGSKTISKLATLFMRAHARWIATRAFSRLRVPPILVYQMGKVASSTVCASLREAGIDNTVLHLHFLSDDLPAHIEAHKNSGIERIPYHLILGLAVKRQLRLRADNTCKIITLVRDPIALFVSNIFQNPQFVEEDIKNEIGFISADKIRAFLHRKMSDPSAFSYFDDWFERELKSVFEIDVFAQPFDKNSGYQMYSRGNVEVLLIRVEDLSRVGPKAIGDFVGIGSPLRFKPHNARSKTKEGAEYDALLGSFCIEAEICKQIYSRKLVRHFYSEDMINSFVSRWGK